MVEFKLLLPRYVNPKWYVQSTCKMCNMPQYTAASEFDKLITQKTKDDYIFFQKSSLPAESLQDIQTKIDILNQELAILLSEKSEESKNTRIHKHNTRLQLISDYSKIRFFGYVE
jgi:hypothetical protein